MQISLILPHQLFYPNPILSKSRIVIISKDPLFFNDDKYTIHSLAGRIFIDNIEDCLSKRKEIEKEISKVFPSASIKRYEKVKHGYDKSGKSFVWHTRFELKGGGKASIECHDWSKKIEENIADKLMVGLGSNEFHKFVDNEAYR